MATMMELEKERKGIIVPIRTCNRRRKRRQDRLDTGHPINKSVEARSIAERTGEGSYVVAGPIGFGLFLNH